MNEILTILRAIIQDFTGSVYSDSNLNSVIIAAAIAVKHEFYFDTSYTIDIGNQTITPDPSDNVFIILCAYRAAIMLITSEIRTYSRQQFKIVDGPSTVDISGIVSSFKDLLKSLLEQYYKMKLDFNLYRESGGFGQCIVTPTTVEYISPSNF